MVNAISPLPSKIGLSNLRELDILYFICFNPLCISHFYISHIELHCLRCVDTLASKTIIFQNHMNNNNLFLIT